jgi:tetratricopeptide (TPR) repeat protein
MSNHQGQFLAALPRNFHALRGPFLQWAAPYGQADETVLGHLRRALIGWYEASIDPTDPYVGKVNHYVQRVAAVYFSGKMEEALMAAERMPLAELGMTEAQNPLNHLPRPIHLSATQQLMLTQFKEMGKNCRELLMMSDYHRLTVTRMAEVLNLEGRLAQLEDQRSKCLLMVREGWQAGGIIDPVHTPSPIDEELINRYYSRALGVAERWNVEARRPGDRVFREAMELREDWAEVVTVAGRQDLMETLMREEGKYAVKRPSAPAAAPKVKLSPRRKGGIQLGKFELPDLQSLLAVGLFAVLCWLAWSTFGPSSAQRQSVANFEPYLNIFDRYAPRDESERDLKRILYYYDQADYQTAYDELLPVAQAYPAAPLYLGVSALALEQPTRALDWFEQIPDSSFYRPTAEWYEALAYLAEGRKEAAVIVLEDISATPGHEFRGAARQLLGGL